MTTSNMKKFIGSIKRTTNNARSKSSDGYNNSYERSNSVPLPQGDHPEAVVVREAHAFCEAGAPGSPSAGDEYLHLPAIVDACESSPAAAKEAAASIQRYLSKQNFERGYAQYNAIMLLRILTDNPGRNFTQNFDKSFVSTVKQLLRECRDSSVQQITREALDYFEAEKLPSNDSLTALVEMWRKEKGGSARMYASTSGRSHTQGYSRPPPTRAPRGLPPPEELAARIEEAKTSARLLVQMCQSTPANELLNNELIKEFAERARQANKSVQQYMACENPAPDEHTMLTLIETSEQLSIAMTKHQRSVLQARKAMGQSSTGTSPQPQPHPQDPFSTTALQNSLPPQQNRYTQPQVVTQPPPQQQQQQQQQQQHFNQYESEDLYKSNTNTVVTPVSPNVAQPERTYLPPPGPPPGRKQVAPTQPQDQSYEAYNRPTYSPDLGRPNGHQRTESATKDYNVAENPFADDNAYTAPAQYHPPPPPPHQQQTQPDSNPSYTMFNRAAGQLRDPSSPTFANTTTASANTNLSPNQNYTYHDPTTPELDSGSYPVPPPQTNRDQTAPRPTSQGYHSGWQPTASFIGRQQSSEAHITMSGASPPPNK